MRIPRILAVGADFRGFVLNIGCLVWLSELHILSLSLFEFANYMPIFEIEIYRF